MMAGKDDQAGDSAQDGQKVEPVFRLADFTFADPANQATYNHFQKQSTIQKQTNTKFVKDAIKEITTQSKAPQNPALNKMIKLQGTFT